MTPDPPQIAPPTRRRRGRLIVAGIALAILLGAGIATYVLWPRPAAPDDPTSPAKLVIACHEAVSRQLRSPATAQFSNETTSRIGEREWKIIGAVDAQNGFGALIRQQYTCMAVRGDKMWLVNEVLFKDWS